MITRVTRGRSRTNFCALHCEETLDDASQPTPSRPSLPSRCVFVISTSNCADISLLAASISRLRFAPDIHLCPESPTEIQIREAIALPLTQHEQKVSCTFISSPTSRRRGRLFSSFLSINIRQKVAQGEQVEAISAPTDDDHLKSCRTIHTLKKRVRILNSDLATVKLSRLSTAQSTENPHLAGPWKSNWARCSSPMNHHHL